MIDLIHPVDEFVHHALVHNGIDHQMKAGMIEQWRHVLQAARREVVDDIDFIAARNQTIGQMRADKSGSSCDQYVHNEGYSSMSSHGTYARLIFPSGGIGSNGK